MVNVLERAKKCTEILKKEIKNAMAGNFWQPAHPLFIGFVFLLREKHND
jgi:hypothetical protein